MRVAVVTVSTSRSIANDTSGDTLVASLGDSGFTVVQRDLVTDERAAISAKLNSLIRSETVDLIVTTGGTGVAPLDMTPEATRDVVEREIPGMAEALRNDALTRTPRGMLSRGVCGVAGKCLIVNLPGSPKACSEGLAILLPVLPHALALIADAPVDH